MQVTRGSLSGSERAWNMKIWLDDLKEKLPGYVRAYSVDEAKRLIEDCEAKGEPVEMIELDYDLGEYELHGGKGLRLLEWLHARGTHYPVDVHSTHIYGAQKMRKYIRKN